MVGWLVYTLTSKIARMKRTLETNLTRMVDYSYQNVLTLWHCTEREIIAKALCNDNKLSLASQQLLINKASCPEHKNELPGKVPNPIMHIKAVLQCVSSLTLTLKGSVDNTSMQLYKQKTMDGPQ